MQQNPGGNKENTMAVGKRKENKTEDYWNDQNKKDSLI